MYSRDTGRGNSREEGAGVHRGQLGEEGGDARPGAALELREELHGARL